MMPCMIKKLLNNISPNHIAWVLFLRNIQDKTANFQTSILGSQPRILYPCPAFTCSNTLTTSLTWTSPVVRLITSTASLVPLSSVTWISKISVNLVYPHLSTIFQLSYFYLLANISQARPAGYQNCFLRVRELQNLKCSEWYYQSILRFLAVCGTHLVVFSE